MNTVFLFSVLLLVIVLYWLHRTYVKQKVNIHGALAFVYSIVCVSLLLVGVWQYEGIGARLVFVTCAIAAFKHGRNYYKAKIASAT
jgi:hypothetical protein